MFSKMIELMRSSSFILSFLFFPRNYSSILMKNLHLNISTIYKEPFLFEITGLDNETQLIGLVRSLVDELQLRIGFQYNFIPSPDGNYGSPIDNNSWNGIIGEVFHGRAHLGVADLTINAHRSEIVDFTVPFMQTELAVVYKKPTVKFGVTAFVMPFTKYVWLTILFCLLLSAAALYFFGMFNSQNTRLNSIGACLYFTFACLFGQGPESYPKSFASRITAVSWWFFSIAMLTLYSASLTAMMTVNRGILPLKSIEDLLKYPQFHYAIEPGQATHHAFRHTEYEPFKVSFCF